MPDTRPGVPFINGVCAACVAYENRKEVDWEKRREELKAFLSERSGGPNYDCIVPVSGGKDSTFQVLTIKSLGFRPLCITATTDFLTSIGRRNIDNLKSLGVDYVEVTVDTNVRKRINKFALMEVGDISLPEHITIFTIPLRFAIQMNVPVLIWGENPQNEYGGDEKWAGRTVLDRKWLEEHGGLNGLTSERLAESGFDRKDMIQYFYPPAEIVERSKVQGVFLGQYVPWDGLRNALLSTAFGMCSNNRAIEGNIFNYENLDNAQTGIHDYFCYLKFGFGRTAAQASLLVRRGLLRRDEAIRLCFERDGVYPATYLGVPLDTILRDIDMSKDEWQKTCDKFTNWELFKGHRRDGSPLLREF
jgi:N-acetyl sugar amidotransferase